MLEFDVGSSQSYPAKEVEAMLSGAPATLASIALEGVATLAGGGVRATQYDVFDP